MTFCSTASTTISAITRIGGTHRLAYTPSGGRGAGIQGEDQQLRRRIRRSAGFTMNATSKSGTNEYHGSAFEFLRNDKAGRQQLRRQFRAQPRAPSSVRTSSAAHLAVRWRAPRYNGRNRTFFFVDYEGAAHPQASGSTLLECASECVSKGDLSSSTTPVYDPRTRVLGSNGVASAQVFAGNVIPASRLDPVVLKYQDLMPKPNVGAPEASPQTTSRLLPNRPIATRATPKWTTACRRKTTSWLASRFPSRRSPIRAASFGRRRRFLFNTVNAALSDTTCSVLAW